METSEPPADTAGRVAPWGSLAFRDFRLFWFSALSHGVSRYMREMLNYFLIYEISGSAVKLGLTGLFQVIPVLILGLVAGSLADSVDRKKLLIVTYTFGLIPPFTLAALAFTGNVAVWHLWTLTSMTSVVTVLSSPAQRALIPKLVPRSHLMNAVTLQSAPTQGALMVGPILAGALVDVWSVGGAYLVNGAFQVAALLMFVSMRTSGLPEGGRRSVSLKSITDGLRFIQTHQIIWAGFLIDIAVMGVGYYRVLLPAIAKDVYGVGATGLGVLSAAPAIGAVAATVGLLLLGDVRRKGVLILVSYLLFALFLALLGAAPWFWLGVVAASGLGLADMGGYTARQTLIQLVAPDDFRGRTSATSQIFSNLANGVGATEIGIAAGFLGPPGALLLGAGLATTFVAMIAFKVRALWSYRS